MIARFLFFRLIETTVVLLSIKAIFHNVHSRRTHDSCGRKETVGTRLQRNDVLSEILQRSLLCLHGRDTFQGRLATRVSQVNLRVPARPPFLIYICTSDLYRNTATDHVCTNHTVHQRRQDDLVMPHEVMEHLMGYLDRFTLANVGSARFVGRGGRRSIVCAG